MFVYTKNTILLCWCAVFILSQLGTARGNFHPGKARGNEMDRLHGVMTPREAVFVCESDSECAGFAFRGPKTLVDEPFDTIFYSAIMGHIDTATAGLWSSFVKPVQFTIYNNQLPSPYQTFNRYITLSQEAVYSQADMAHLCMRYHCAAVSLNTNGTVRLYSHLQMGRFNNSPGWKTMFNLSPLNYTESLRPNFLFSQVNRCCSMPKHEAADDYPEHFKFEVPRIPCNISKQEFLETVVRSRKVVILTGCDSQYLWLKDLDLSLAAATKMFYDNETILENPIDILPNTFTHQNTPNDFFETNSDTMHKLANGYLRMFARLRRNTNCKMRGNSCDLFGNMKPAPIPEDIYPTIGYQNDLDWMILSNKDTGSDLHNDPDVMGAWNYLINGKKHWVVFPKGDAADFELSCDRRCSEYVTSGDTVKMWFNSVLPQIQHKQVLGEPILQAVQQPGEAIYLPFGVPHTILNIEDNVAVTENHLFVDAVPAFMNHLLVLDDIRPWRPNFNVERASRNIYNSHLLNKKDRLLIRENLRQLEDYMAQYPQVKRDRIDYNKWRVAQKFPPSEVEEEEDYDFDEEEDFSEDI